MVPGEEYTVRISNKSTLALPQRLLALALVMLAMAALAVVANGNRPAYASGCTYKLSASSYSVNEGQAAQVTVIESGSCADQISRTAFVSWNGVGTATPNVDFQNASFGANFATGAPQTRVVLIPTYPDNENESSPNETFTVLLTAPNGGTLDGSGFVSAIITIVDDDGPSTYSYQTGSTSFPESAGAVTVTVLRGGATAGTASVDCVVSGGGTATGGGVDYTLTDGTANFADGSNSATCGLTIIQDSATETGGETIILGFANPVNLPGGAIAPTSMTITITDDDGPGTIQFASAAYSVGEGTVGSFAVTRTGGNTPVSVTCSSTAGPNTATANVDYNPNTGQTLSFSQVDPGPKYCNVQTLSDALVEGPEQFGLILSAPTNGATLGTPSTATVTIEDDDGTGQIVFSSTSYAGNENGGPITITVNRTGGTGGGTVTYATSAGPAPSATAGVDYTAATGILSWASGDLTPKTFTVTPINDSLIEGAENFTLTLSNPTGGLTLGTPSTAVLTITDDESPFPTITSISPPSGTIGGQTAVTITGVNFTGATLVTFGGFACGSVVVVNATTITCVTPAHGGGVVDVIVTTPAGPSGTSGTANDYTYTGGPTITSLNPATGQASGNTIVTITGTNFTQNGTTVKFDGVIAVFTYIDPETLIAASPPHSAGTVRVSVTTPGGTTPDTAADDFTYTGASIPAVTALSPTSGPIGTTVIITGSGFTGANLVTFGGISATYTVNSDAQVTASVPAGTAAGTVDVRVSTPSGTSANTANDDFNNTSSGATLTYTLFFRFTLIVWTGQNNVSALQALRGLESPDNPATNSVLGLVGAIWRFDASTQTFKGYFPGSDAVPGANDFTTLQSGVGYFIALINPGTVSWTVLAN